MNKRFLVIFTFVIAFYGCSGSRQAAKKQPVAPPSKVQKKIDFSTLQEPPKDWHEMDGTRDQFRGISSELAYQTILKNKKPKKQVVVAVIDGGVDINHEDLKGIIWVNKGEIPGNGKDDDGNGFVDDVHGWNFIGGKDGKDVNHDTLELTRIYARLHAEFSDADTTQFDAARQKEYARYKKIKAAYESAIKTMVDQYNNVQSLQENMQQAQQILQKQFGDTTYTYDDVKNLKPANRQQQVAQNVMLYVMDNNIDSTLIADQKKQLYEEAKYEYDPDFNTRTIVGDNYADKTEHHYGNNDVKGPDPTHGTHVSGIIAAMRNNGIGMNGIAGDVRIMVVRVVPQGDERDKDVANGIRYAVDNGADIINMSFGKSYSPYKEVVDDAVKYADAHHVLMVHASGNESKDTDTDPSYPTDRYGDALQSHSTAKDWISVGASSWKPDSNFVADFSNYGKQTVDVFAPGVGIYSSVPDNKYERFDGTSMASPVVAGTAALIMSYYPNLSTAQLKQIILDSTVKYPGQQVMVPHGHGKQEAFSQLSVTGGEVNVYKALQAAERLSH